MYSVHGSNKLGVSERDDFVPSSALGWYSRPLVSVTRRRCRSGPGLGATPTMRLLLLVGIAITFAVASDVQELVSDSERRSPSDSYVAEALAATDTLSTISDDGEVNEAITASMALGESSGRDEVQQAMTATSALGVKEADATEASALAATGVTLGDSNEDEYFFCPGDGHACAGAGCQCQPGADSCCKMSSKGIFVPQSCMVNSGCPRA